MGITLLRVMIVGRTTTVQKPPLIRSAAVHTAELHVSGLPEACSAATGMVWLQMLLAQEVKADVVVLDNIPKSPDLCFEHGACQHANLRHLKKQLIAKAHFYEHLLALSCY